MNNDQNNMNNSNQPNVQPNLGNQMSYDNKLTSNPQQMPATSQQMDIDPQQMPSLGPIDEPELTPMSQTDNITGKPVEPSKPEKPKKKGSGGALIIVIILIIIVVIAAVGFFIGKNMIDSETGSKETVTDKTAKNTEPELKTIDYNGVSLIIPNGYTAELNDDLGVLFKTSDKAYNMDFFEGTISDLDSALLEMGAVSKGNKEIDDISFSLYSYTKSGKTELIYVTDTNRFRIMGFCVNSSYTYNEKIVKDVVISLSGNKENISKFSPSESVKSKINSKALKSIYEFETE